jgi:hypothetical protein
MLHDRIVLALAVFGGLWKCERSLCRLPGHARTAEWRDAARPCASFEVMQWNARTADHATNPTSLPPPTSRHARPNAMRD